MTVEYTYTQAVEVFIDFTLMKMTHFDSKRSIYLRIVVNKSPISVFEVDLFWNKTVKLIFIFTCNGLNIKNKSETFN